MFGVMRPANCCSEKNSDDYTFHRMHYCGTCKTIGHSFDHKSRMLLNHDTVFLAEVLSQLSNQKLEDWSQPFQQINQCFKMPQSADLPASLEFSANATVLLAALKLDDNIKDSSKWRWKLLSKIYNGSFEKAVKYLQKAGVDTNEINDLIDLQEHKEKHLHTGKSLEEHLHYYAASTAEITAMLFEVGAEYLDINTNLYDFGFEFGKLMYLVDALEDYEEDIFKKQFNPFGLIWNNKKYLSDGQINQMRTQVLNSEKKVIELMQALPIEDKMKELYAARLSSNIALRIYKDRIVPTNAKERIIKRWKEAKSYATNIICTPNGWWGQLNFYVMAWVVFVSPQASEYLPHDAKMEVFKWSAFIAAALAGVGIAGAVVKKRKKRGKEKRKQKRLKRFFRKLKGVLFRKNSCWDACCSSCCNSCCDGCCDSCCQSISNSDEPWFWILMLLALILLTGLIVLILYLAGVI